MGQVYEDVRRFDRALEESGLDEREFMQLNGLGPSAITEWRRARSRMAPKWAVVQASLLAELKKLRGVKFAEVVEVPPSEYINMSAVWGKNKHGEESWILSNGEIFSDVFTSAEIKANPLWEKMTPGQKMAWLTGGVDMPGSLEEFFNKWCKPPSLIE